MKGIVPLTAAGVVFGEASGEGGGGVTHVGSGSAKYSLTGTTML
jgi:hypothetical protein